MTTPTVPPDLLDPNDFAKFKSKDEAWFLGVAGDAIRDECGWHIYPVISQTNVPAVIGNEGIIMLPSLNIVSVEQVVWNGVSLVESVDFTVHVSGWLQLLRWSPPQAPVFTRQRGSQRGAMGIVTLGVHDVSVDFTHGFETLPRSVSEVGFELAAGTMEKPAGAVSDLTAGPYRFKFRDGLGATLSDEQKSRLGPYSIVRVGE